MSVDSLEPGPQNVHQEPAQAEAVAPGSIRLFFSPPDRSTFGPALFLDRDGVINERILDGYVTDWDSFRFVPGIAETIRALSSLGPPIIVVSNQAGVGKRLMSVRVLAEITRRFVEALRRERARIDAVYYCPHTPLEACRCRKPRPGLLEDAAGDWGLDLGSSVLVGDDDSDVVAAKAVGCRAITFSRETQIAGGEASDSLLVSDPREIVPAVIRLLGAPEESATGRAKPSSR